MSGLLTDKQVLITGAGSGIGAAAARIAAREGARLLLADVDEDAVAQVAASLTRGAAKVHHRACDISEEDQVEALIEFATSLGRLDCAVNNAGIGGNVGPAADCTTAEWDRTVAVNLSGTFFCLRAELRAMLEAGTGAVVNTASTFGIVGSPHSLAYVATKHAVVGMTRAAALDYAREHIRVNAVCPGVTDTPLLSGHLSGLSTNPYLAGIPMGRMASPAEIGEAVIWLCSDQASYVTGLVMPVDGGWTAR